MLSVAKRHPFADTRPLNPPFLGKLEQRSLSHTLSMLALAKSLAFTGPSGVGKSTFVQHLIRQLDPKHYQPVFLAYAGLKRSGPWPTCSVWMLRAAKSPCSSNSRNSSSNMARNPISPFPFSSSMTYDWIRGMAP